jgi:hypothetical protein
MSKHLAFLVDCPKEGEVMMFYDYYENLKDYIDTNYDEVTVSPEQLINLAWRHKLNSSNYKVFKQKNSNDNKD